MERSAWAAITLLGIWYSAGLALGEEGSGDQVSAPGPNDLMSFAAPIPVETSVSRAAPCVARDLDDGLIVAWHDETLPQKRIFAVRLSKKGWQKLDATSARGTGLSDSPGSASAPEVMVDPEGRAVVAWQDDRSGMFQIYVKRLEGGRWHELGDSPAGRGISATRTSSLSPALAVDREGRPVVAWQAFTDSGDWSIYVKRFESGRWSPLGLGSASGLGMSGASDARAPDVAVDAKGAPLIAWQQHDERLRSFQIYVRRFNGERWTQMGSGSDGDGGVSRSTGRASTPALVIDKRGQPVVAWTDDSSGTRQIYVKRLEGDAWREVGRQSASGKGISDPKGDARAPAVTVDQQNRILVAWATVSDDGAGVAVKRFDGRVWQPLGSGLSSAKRDSKRPKSTDLPSIAVDSEGMVTTLWQVHLDITTPGIVGQRYDGKSWKSLNDLPR